MAIIHQAQLSPSKIELLSSWVPAQRWLGGADASALEAVGAYRFDDPADEVGIETHLFRTADGRTLQVPVTYRAAPLAGAESALIGTLQHSVLGERWVYDGCADPVYAKALAAAVLTGGTEAALEYPPGTEGKPRPATARVVGSGSSVGDSAVSVGPSVTYADAGTTTIVRSGDWELVVLRWVGSDALREQSGDAHTLRGTWPGRDTPTLLATVVRP